MVWLLDRYAIHMPIGYIGLAIGLNQIQFTTYNKFADGNIATIQLYSNNRFKQFYYRLAQIPSDGIRLENQIVKFS